jgi:(4-O-methyl)-D-glucuronate---lignin esterase
MPNMGRKGETSFNVKRRQFIEASVLLASSTCLSGITRASAAGRQSGDEWLREFATPPAGAYPWVYAFWMDGNITMDGITADLEAMRQAGIRGMIFMDAAVGNPRGPHRFMSESWLEMFQHMLVEADRLGIEINLSNAPGDAGSGGPWVEPRQASQKVIIAETMLQGPMLFRGRAPLPTGINHGFYADIAVLAYPAPADGRPISYRIPDFGSTKTFAGDRDFFSVVPWPRFIPTSSQWPEVARDQCVRSAEMHDLTSRLASDGTLTWDVPRGHWVVLRFGHTVSNGTTRTAQPESQGLECDKLDKSAVAAHFAAMVGKLSDRAGALVHTVLVATHIDSWEAGSGNWTGGFREEFRRRRGYDLLPFLPTLHGIVVDSREVAERFLWDYRETVSELVLDNYASHFRELAHDRGLRLSIEAYDGPCDDLRYAGRADEPMSEFWRSSYSGLPLGDLTESMASAAHVYGRQVVAAEAFTSYRGDFLDHPGTLKPLADWAFCTGVNRLCFHHWLFQPWRDVVPGVSYSIVGTVFHRSLTWWQQSKPWHEYLARCQHMLRQGQFVADICFLAPEGAPCRFTPPIPTTRRGGIPERPEYNFDGCPAELVLNEMTVRKGLLELPSGMKYRILVLPTYNAGGQPVMRLTESDEYVYKPTPMPEVRTMTPSLLRKVRDLVREGATVLGFRPVKSPSLADFPQCDVEVRQLADELWGVDAGIAGSGERRIGSGRVVWGSTPEQVLAAMGVAPDVACQAGLKGKLNYTHRRTTDGKDIYFVVNTEAGVVHGEVSFRATGRRAELYWPETGHTDPVLAYTKTRGLTTLAMSLQANESVFVVFRPLPREPDPVIHIIRDSETLWPRTTSAPREQGSHDGFMMAAWVNTSLLQEIALPGKSAAGWRYASGEVDVPGPGIQTYTAPGQGRYGFIVGANGVVVFQYGDAGTVHPLLVHAEKLTAVSTHIGVIREQAVIQLFIDGQLAQTDATGPASADRDGGPVLRRPVAGELAALEQFEEMLESAGSVARIAPGSTHRAPALDFSRAEIWSSGTYVFRTTRIAYRQTVSLPPPQEIAGSWRVEFDPSRGGPANVTFESLQDWRESHHDGIKYYSGAATYHKTFAFTAPRDRTPNHRVYLDLGLVEVMAEVIVNGLSMSILWKSPYRVDVTDVIRRGENTLAVKVINVWVNRLIGDERLPEDSDRSPDGTLRSWPQWIGDGQPRSSGRFTLASHRLWTQDSPLVRSGLLGPVKLWTAERVRI